MQDLARGSTTEQPFRNFDFDRGKRYPERARIAIEDVQVAPGADAVHVAVTLDRPTPNTVVARVLTRNGSAKEGEDFERVDRHVVFRPGDPLVQTVRVPLKRIAAGERFELIFPITVSGARRDGAAGEIVAVEGAPPTVAATAGFREALTFQPRGEPRYELDVRTVQWSAAGGRDSWSTALAHGRTQPANGETGLYLDPVLHPEAEPPVRRDGGALVLHSQQLENPIEHEGTVFRHGAVVLSGRRMPETQVLYGQYEWIARMPNRRGAWPSLWLVATGGWPPEIDVFEAFGYAQDWDFDNDISANLHGGPRGRRNFTVPMRTDGAALYGLTGLSRDFHSYAVDIAPDFITWFIDGREVYQAVNPFHQEAFYPIMTVAVKSPDEFTGGSAEMRVHSFKVWSDAS
ncbi:family 16 glycosylhydrolase [Aurantiacibacter poecillastricola]|uniref:family 16 glycosylhydrolase n=1 Tax=Aurantiacibacter poecillastricola TaxID=3064385 RepID=UPI00273DA145|nr:family 16 glycosylhydrolase [Aurantiacibacter sp. 219JJ12-13]MDP5263234.1 family 16 glycosylhydrolase [Aurantiacibacter sp. 219JJ12-13]